MCNLSTSVKSRTFMNCVRKELCCYALQGCLFVNPCVSMVNSWNVLTQHVYHALKQISKFSSFPFQQHTFFVYLLIDDTFQLKHSKKKSNTLFWIKHFVSAERGVRSQAQVFFRWTCSVINETINRMCCFDARCSILCKSIHYANAKA